MIQITAGGKVYLACRPVSMRYGFNRLAAQVAPIFGAEPFSGHGFIFSGKRSDYLKILYYGGSGFCLFARRLELGKFVRPAMIDSGTILEPVTMALLIEEIDWRRTLAPEWSRRPVAVTSSKRCLTLR